MNISIPVSERYRPHSFVYGGLVFALVGGGLFVQSLVRHWDAPRYDGVVTKHVLEDVVDEDGQVQQVYRPYVQYTVNGDTHEFGDSFVSNVRIDSVGKEVTVLVPEGEEPLVYRPTVQLLFPFSFFLFGLLAFLAGIYWLYEHRQIEKEQNDGGILDTDVFER